MALNKIIFLHINTKGILKPYTALKINRKSKDFSRSEDVLNAKDHIGLGRGGGGTESKKRIKYSNLEQGRGMILCWFEFLFTYSCATHADYV